MPVSAATPIRVARSAENDLDQIIAWYTDQHVPEVGQRLVSEILIRVEQLAAHPESGRIVPEFGLTNLRELIHPPFRIVYRRETTHITIIRIWRSERLLYVPTVSKQY